MAKRLKTQISYSSLYAEKKLNEIEKEVEERLALNKKRHKIMATNWTTPKAEKDDDVFNEKRMAEFFKNKAKKQ